MLSSSEKETLYLVIASVVGEDISIRNVTASFNLKTVEVVERMVKTSEDCNESMKALASALLGPSVFRGKGWLLKVAVPVDKPNGLGCRVAVKARWKSPILLSVI